MQSGLKGHTAIARAIHKYGAVAFTVGVIATCLDDATSGLVESALIVQHGTKAPCGYNLTDGGDGVKGLPPDIIARIAAANKGYRHTDDAKLRIGLAAVGRTKSKLTRETMNAAKRGKPLSIRHREKMSLAKIGKKRPLRTATHCARIAEGLRRAHALRKSKVESELLQ